MVPLIFSLSVSLCCSVWPCVTPHLPPFCFSSRSFPSGTVVYQELDDLLNKTTSGRKRAFSHRNVRRERADKLGMAKKQAHSKGLLVFSSWDAVRCRAAAAGWQLLFLSCSPIISVSTGMNSLNKSEPKDSKEGLIWIQLITNDYTNKLICTIFTSGSLILFFFLTALSCLFPLLLQELLWFHFAAACYKSEQSPDHPNKFSHYEQIHGEKY